MVVQVTVLAARAAATAGLLGSEIQIAEIQEGLGEIYVHDLLLYQTSFALSGRVHELSA
jgi:hypothetical protein